jgi:tetratricopeptide (TPR) repeat protein
MTLRPGLVLLATLILTACLGAVLPRAVAADEPHWIEVHTAHFSVITDAGEKRGREVTLRLEQMRAVAGRLLLRTRLTMPVPLTVIALKSDKDFARVAPLVKGQPTNAPGFLLNGDDRAWIVLNLFAEEPWRAVSHPFAHLILNYNYPPTQGWFDEGFAEYFSSIRVSDKLVEIGADPELTPIWREDLLENQIEARNPPKSLTELLSAPIWLSMPDLFTVKHDSSIAAEGSHHTLFYAQSWMVMHYLLNKGKLTETGTYFDLVQNQKVPPEQAIQQAFGMTSVQFEQAVKDYFHSLAPLFRALDDSKEPGNTRPLTPQPVQLPALLGPDDVAMNVTPMTEPDARANIADVMARLPEHRDQAVRDLQFLIKQPVGKENLPMNNAIAHRVLAYVHIQNKEFDAASDELDEAAEGNPRDPWIHYYSALLKYRMAQTKQQEIQGLSNMMQDLRMSLDWYPDFAEAYNMLAMARVEGGGIVSALEAVRTAIKLSPRNEQYVFNLGVIYASGKKWDEARAVLDRLKSSANTQVAAAAKRQLQDMETLKRYGIPPAHAAQVTRPAPVDPDEEPVKPAKPEPPRTGPIQFLKGKLLSVDCSHPPDAILNVSAGARVLKLHTPDFKSLSLIGAESFSCDWRNQPISVNFRPTSKTEGEVVSLEIQ